MDFEPLTIAEQKIYDDVEKTFGNKDVGLKKIVLYTRLLELNPNDEELKMKLQTMKDKIKRLNEAVSKNVEKDLKCTMDKDGNIFPISNV